MSYIVSTSKCITNTLHVLQLLACVVPSCVANSEIWELELKLVGDRSAWMHVRCMFESIFFSPTTHACFMIYRYHVLISITFVEGITLHFYQEEGILYIGFLPDIYTPKSPIDSYDSEQNISDHENNVNESLTERLMEDIEWSDKCINDRRDQVNMDNSNNGWNSGWNDQNPNTSNTKNANWNTKY